MRKLLFTSATIFTVLFGILFIAQAGHQGYSMFSTDISDMDKNNDGMVTFEEYSAHHSEQLRWSFNALDTDNNGSINESEWEQFLKMHGVGEGYDHNQQG